MRHNDLLIAARVAKHWTQQELAKRCGVTVRTVRHWETGVRPQEEHLRMLLQIFEVEHPEDLGFAATRRHGPRGTVKAGGARRKGWRMLNRRDLLAVVVGAMGGAMAAPVTGLLPAPTETFRVGASDVKRVELLRASSYNLERMMGGGAINPNALIPHLRHARALLDGVYRSDATRIDMHEAFARFATVGAWSLVDQGEHALAQRVFGAALAATDGASDERRPALRALVLTDMSRQAIYLEDYKTATELLDFLDSNITKLPDDVRAIVFARRARALGGLGDSRAVTILSQRAEHEFKSSKRSSAREYKNNAFGIQELTSDLGHAYSSLAVSYGVKTTEAEQRVSEAIASYGPDDVRSRALAGIRLTNVYLAQGDGARALETLREHVPAAQGVRSSGVNAGATAGIHLALRAKRAPGMADVVELFRGISAPAISPT